MPLPSKVSRGRSDYRGTSKVEIVPDGNGVRRRGLFPRRRRIRRRLRAAAARADSAGGVARAGGGDEEQADAGEDEQRQRDRGRVARADRIGNALEEVLRV